jgi:acetyl-CoA acetyltransferase
VHTLRDAACIIGIGETRYERKSDRQVDELVFEAIERACADAGINPRDIDGISAQPLVGDGVTPTTVQENFGIADLKFLTTAQIAAGAGLVAAVGNATMALDAGLCDYVVSWFSNVWGSMAFSPGDAHDAQPDKRDFETPYGWYGQPAHLGMCARRHMAEFGTTSEQLGAIAVKLREHAGLHGNAVYTEPITLDDYLASRYIAEPLRLYDCCVISDGATAFVMSRPDRARSRRKSPVSVKGFGHATSDRSYYWAEQPDLTHTLAVRSAPRAYAMAGVGPDDVDFMQCYDCFTWVVLSTIEDHGFCPKGEGGPFVQGGENISIGGRLPINTSGGMLSQAYQMGNNHLCEAVRQLRGDAGATQIDNPEIGIVGGYSGIAYGTLVLGKGQS